MLLIPLVRETLLNFLPQGGIVAEIGVAQGEFSRHILDKAKPGKLHLIDPWIHQEDEQYQADENNASDDEQDSRYAAVSAKFRDLVDNGQVVLHRAFSQDICGEFDDGCLDWVYIDGMHTYEGVKRDLEAYQSKVAADGFILGHDYTNNPGAKDMKFGVVQAVDEFVKETNWNFVGLTTESFPTYVLTRDTESERAKTLFLKLIYNIPNLVEIRDYPGPDFQHKVFPFDTKKVAQVFSF